MINPCDKLNDERVEKYFIKSISIAVGIPESNLLKMLPSMKAIESFLYDNSCLLLIAAHFATTGILSLSNEVYDQHHANEYESRGEIPINIVFIKKCNAVNLSLLNITSIQSLVLTMTIPTSVNLISSIYSSIQFLYSPIFEKGSNEVTIFSCSKSSLSYKAENTLLELNQLMQSLNSSTDLHSSDVNIFSRVQTPMQEVFYWKKKCTSGDGQGVNESARKIYIQFQEIEEILQFIEPGRAVTENVVGNFLSEKIFLDLDFFDENFIQHSYLESVLHNVFQVTDTIGIYIYKSEVRLNQFLKV